MGNPAEAQLKPLRACPVISVTTTRLEKMVLLSSASAAKTAAALSAAKPGTLISELGERKVLPSEKRFRITCEHRPLSGSGDRLSWRSDNSAL